MQAMRKDFDPIISCLFFCWMNRHSRDIISHFASYSYSSVKFYSVAATVQFHSYLLLCSTGAPLMNRIIKNNHQ